MIPPRVLLAPIDFSDTSRIALAWAAQLARRWHADLHVLHVLDPVIAAAAATRGMDIAGATRQDLGEFMASTGIAGDWAPLHHVAIGHAAEAICAEASACGADLIVAGTHGLSGFNRLMMGTTIEGVLRKAHTSVAVVPAAMAAPGDNVQWGPVVAGIQDPRADALPPAAFALAAALETSVRLLHVVPPVPRLTRWLHEAGPLDEARAREARAALEAGLGAWGGPATTQLEVVVGRPADALAAAATAQTGTHPILMLGRALKGSGHAPGAVASRVISQSTAPVWMHVSRD
jgi:universal stress protein A